VGALPTSVFFESASIDQARDNRTRHMAGPLLRGRRGLLAADCDCTQNCDCDLAYSLEFNSNSASAGLEKKLRATHWHLGTSPPDMPLRWR
jgi:hypothetical protein